MVEVFIFGSSRNFVYFPSASKMRRVLQNSKAALPMLNNCAGKGLLAQLLSETPDFMFETEREIKPGGPFFMVAQQFHQYTYGFWGGHPGFRMLLWYVFVVLPTPVVLQFFFGGIHLSIAYKVFGILGVIFLPIYIWGDIKYRDWFHPIIVQPDGLRINGPGGEKIFLWKDFEKMEPIAHPDWDYYQALSSGVRLTFSGGEVLRIFEKMKGYNDLMEEINEKARKER